jgi:toxin-antitoxin system PIN domain toxin
VSDLSASPRVYLLDANLLIAMCMLEHLHHDDSMRWLTSIGKSALALCAISEGALVRQALRDNPRVGIANAIAILGAVKAWPGCQFWGDSLSYVDIDWRGVIGHKQVTDAYLVALAKSKNAQLASFDRGLAALRPDVVHLVPIRV